ncbi:MAG: GNAT family N-acetyltransferase [Pirellulaceae bacterium]
MQEQLPTKLEKLSESQSTSCLVDGLGAARIAKRMWLEPIHLRPSTKDDSQFLFDLRNDQQVVESSLTGRGVEWSEHDKWFTKMMAYDSSAIWIVCARDGEAIGQVRVDVPDGELHGVVSVALCPTCRGTGIAPSVIRECCDSVSQSFPELMELKAEIKSSNVASQKAFEQAGFVLSSPDQNNVMTGTRTLETLVDSIDDGT